MTVLSKGPVSTGPLSLCEYHPQRPEFALAGLFIPDPQLRADVWALQALFEQVRDIPKRISDHMIGAIRLAWWREEIERLGATGHRPSHPVLAALAELAARRHIRYSVIVEMIEAQSVIFDSDIGGLDLSKAQELSLVSEARLAQLLSSWFEAGDHTTALGCILTYYGLGRLCLEGYVKAPEPEAVKALKQAAGRALKTLPVSLLPLALPVAASASHYRSRLPGPLGLRVSILSLYAGLSL